MASSFKISVALSSKPLIVQVYRGPKIADVRLLICCFVDAGNNTYKIKIAEQVMGILVFSVNVVASVGASSIIDGVIAECKCRDAGSDHIMYFLRLAFRHYRRAIHSFAQEAIQSAMDNSNVAGINLTIETFLHGRHRNVNGWGDVSAYVLEKLIWGEYQYVRGKFKEENCAICLDKFGEDAEASRMPCLHVFHGECLLRWLKRSNLCPVCRGAAC